MKTLISFVLTLIMSFTSTSMLWTSADFEKLNSMGNKTTETPVAYIENDDYVPYQYRNYSQEDTPRESIDFDLNTEFETVFKTITVMTTATGDPKRGNYVANKPIEDALVRIDGVPRYTNKKGQITAPLNREYVELYVEYNGYNPYIEIIEATSEQMTVYLKQPSDDIEIYAAMLNYAGEEFNVLTQPCIINNDVIQYHYSELIISANVEADEYFILVNGELQEYSDEATFYGINFDDWLPGDKISVQVSYSGILSKVVDTFISVEMLDFDDEVITFSAGDQGDGDDLTVGVNTNDDFGIFSGLNIDFNDIINSLDTINMSQNLGKHGNLQLDYNTRTGEFSIRIGFQFEAQSNKKKEKEIEETQEKIQDYCGDMVDLDEQIRQSNMELRQIQEDYIKAAKNQEESGYAEEIKRLDSQRQQSIDRMHNLRGKKKQNAPKMKEEQQKLKDDIDELKRLKDEQDNEVRGLLDRLNQGKETIDTLNRQLDMLKGFTRKEMAKFNSMNRYVKVGLDILGVFEYNVKEKSVQKLALNITVNFGFGWNGMFLVYVIPMYYKVNVNFHGGVDINFYNNKAWVPWEKFLENILLKIGVEARGEIGVGVCDIATIGFFAKFNYEAQVYPGAKDKDGVLYIKQGDKWGHEIIINIGIAIKALLWDWEFSKEIKLLDKDPDLPLDYEVSKVAIANMNLMARSYENIYKEVLSTNEIFTGTYQESKPQIAFVGDKIVMTWIDDDMSRDDYNRSVLKYAIFDNGEWSEPKAIFDDGKADFYQDMYFDGNDLHIVWQKFSKKMKATDNLISSGAASEIYYAKFNQLTGSFDSVERLTDDNSGDFTPVFALKERPEDPLAIVWRKNSDNNILGLSGKNIIYSITKDKAGWAAPERIYESDKYFSFVSSAYKDGILNTAFTEFASLEMDSTRQIKVICENEVDVIAEGQTLNSSDFTIIDNVAVLSYYDGEKIILSRNLVDLENFINLQSEKIGEDYRILSHSSGDKTIVYKKMGENSYSQIYCARFDGNTKKWTYDIQLTSDTQSIVKWTAQLDSDNQVVLTYTIMDEDKNCVTCFASRQFKRDFEISEVIINKAPMPGEEASFVLKITNTGDYNLENITLQAFGIIQSIDTVILVGETGYFEVTFKLPDELPTQEKFTVNALGESREYVVSLAFVDVSLSGEILLENGEQTFVLIVKNDGIISSDYVINIYRNEELIKSKDMSIGATSEEELRYTLEDLYQGDAIYFEIITSENDIKSADNSILLTSKIDTVKVIDTYENKYMNILQGVKSIVI